METNIDTIEKWLKLGDIAIRRSKKLANEFKRYASRISGFSNQIEEYVYKIEKNDMNTIFMDLLSTYNPNKTEYLEAKVFGIDSSMAGLQRIGGFLVVPVAASLISMNIVVDKEHTSSIIDLKADFFPNIPEDIHDGLSPGIAVRKAELAMLNMEVEIMGKILKEIFKNANKPSYIFIDGPIIDPPDIKLGEPEEFEDYMNRRAKHIMQLIGHSNRNVMVIGFVKRIMGQHFFNYMLGRFKQLSKIRDEFKNDWTFVSLILRGYAVQKCRTDRCIVYTKPLPLQDKNAKYFEDNNLYVFYSYVLFNLDTVKGPYRIDLAIPNDYDKNKILNIFREAIYITSTLFPPGEKYPLPITLAHTHCSLPKKDAYNILSSISSNILHELLTKDPNIFELFHILLQSEGEI